MRSFMLALTALSIALPAHAEAPKAKALTDIYKAGFSDCAGAMQKFVEFAHEEDEEYGYFGLWATEKPNDSMATAVTVQSFTDGPGVASISGTRNHKGSCDVVITHTIALPDQPCEEMRKTSFNDWKLWSKMDPATIHEDPTTPNGNAVLTPLGKKGCLIVKTLVGYDIENK